MRSLLPPRSSPAVRRTARFFYKKKDFFLAQSLWAWQWSDALTLEDGFPGDTGPWAEFGGTSDPPAVEFFDYDDLGIDDDDYG